MIRVGPAGWSYADWEGVVYPRQKGVGFHPLKHLARFLDCVELNSSFYSLPRAEHAERWIQCVADRPGFRFTAKLLRTFTHEEPLDRQGFERSAAAYMEGLEPLRRTGRLSALLVQFPWSFLRSPQAEERLALLSERFASEAPLVLEVRHRSWYEPAALERIGAWGYSLARIDLPAARDHPPADAPDVGPLGYLRVHGRNSAAWFDPRAGRDRRYDYLYTPDEVAELVQVTRRLARGHDETFVVTNNHFAGKAVANALELLAGLGGGPPLAPIELVEAYPRLSATVRTEGQQHLF